MSRGAAFGCQICCQVFQEQGGRGAARRPGSGGGKRSAGRRGREREELGGAAVGAARMWGKRHGWGTGCRESPSASGLCKEGKCLTWPNTMGSERTEGDVRCAQISGSRNLGQSRSSSILLLTGMQACFAPGHRWRASRGAKQAAPAPRWILGRWAVCCIYPPACWMPILVLFQSYDGTAGTVCFTQNLLLQAVVCLLP